MYEKRPLHDGDDNNSDDDADDGDDDDDADDGDGDDDDDGDDDGGGYGFGNIESDKNNGSSNHHDGSSLQVAVGARIERKPLVEWSVSPFVVTALMPRDSGSKGLRISDRVLAINGQSVTHMATSDSLYDLLVGPLGTSVDIVVDRVTCAPQPLALSVPRSSIEEHFGGKVFSEGEVILQGWISKDGRFSSTFKRRWAKLKVPNVNVNSFRPCFEFSWGEIGPTGFVENSSASFFLRERESVCITPLDHPPHGQQLPAPCSVYGFMLQIGSRTISIFCDSKFARDIWTSVLNMAKRTNNYRLSSGSIFTTHHQPAANPWVQYDAEISVALSKLEETRAMASSLESSQQEEASEGEQFQQQQLEQDLLQLQTIAASSGLENQVALLTKLLHSTVTRVQVLERQNRMMHAETRAQNAIIEQLTAQTKQLQLHSANLHRQVARAMYTENDDRASEQAHKFAESILINVLGAQHTHTVTVSEEKPTNPNLDSVDALHNFAASYSTTAEMNASKQKLRDASLRSNQAFQQQLLQRP